MQNLILAAALLVRSNADVSCGNGVCRAAEARSSVRLAVRTTGNCHCRDGSVKQVSCSTVVVVRSQKDDPSDPSTILALLETTKQKLLSELRDQARAQNGTLDESSVRFTIQGTDLFSSQRF